MIKILCYLIQCENVKFSEISKKQFNSSELKLKLKTYLVLLIEQS